MLDAVVSGTVDSTAGALVAGAVSAATIVVGMSVVDSFAASSSSPQADASPATRQIRMAKRRQQLQPTLGIELLGATTGRVLR